MEGLNTKYRNTEIRFQSALIQEAAEKEESPDSDVDGEIFEIRELRHNVNTTAYIYAALQDQPLEGREKELNDALKLAGAGTVMPMAALLSNEDRLELRAATNAPSDSDVIVQQILGRVFAGGALAHLGVSFPAVPTGASNYPVISAGVVPATADKGGAANQTAASITANKLDPKRLTAEYLVRIEDIMTLRNMEDAMRMDLAGALTEAADKEGIIADGSDPDITGFDTALTAASDPAAESTFSDYASARPGMVDGRYAMSAEGVRLVVGAATYAHAATKFQTGSGQAALSMLNARVSPFVAAPASDIQRAFASRSMGRAVAPMWPSVSLIRDNVSRFQQGRNPVDSHRLVEFPSVGFVRFRNAQVQTSLRVDRGQTGCRPPCPPVQSGEFMDDEFLHSR